MASDLAKGFEQKFREDWLKLPDSTIDRLYDPMGGYGGITNVSDFIGYRFPYICYMETKTKKGNTFPFTNLTQYDKLIKKIGIKGVIAGVVIWFYEKDTVVFVPIEVCKQMKENGEKSINCDKILKNSYEPHYEITIIPSEKIRVYMNSDYSVLFEGIAN